MLFGRRPFGEGQTQERMLSEQVHRELSSLLNVLYSLSPPSPLPSSFLSFPFAQTMLNVRGVEFPSKPQVSNEAKDFIRRCLEPRQSDRPDVVQICASAYLRQKKL